MESILEATPKDNPSTPSIQLSIAELSMMNEEYEKAIEILQTLSEMAKDLPSRISMAERMAVCYQKLGDNAAAVALYDDILKDIDDDKIRGSVLIGKAFYLMQGDRKGEANDALNEGMVQMQKQYDDSLDPQMKIRIKTEMARAYELLERDDKAEASYREIIDKFSDQPSIQETYETLAVFLANKKQWKEAREVLEAEKKNFSSPIISQRVDAMIDRLSALELQDNSTTPSLSANDKAKTQ
jgi:tetratricopeptide (TPR) repeat protein